MSDEQTPIEGKIVGYPHPAPMEATDPKTSAQPHVANTILGDVPDRHVEGESMLEGAKADMLEDLDAVSKLKGRRLIMVVAALTAAVMFVLMLLALFNRGDAALTGGTKVKVNEMTFGAPQGWSVKELPAPAGMEGAKPGATLLNPTGDDVIQVVGMDMKSFGNKKSGELSKEMCDDMAGRLEAGMEGAKVTKKPSSIEGLPGCTLRGVGVPSSPIEGLGDGKKLGQTSTVVSVVESAKTGKLVVVFGSHTNKTKYADGQVELSVLNQSKGALK